MATPPLELRIVASDATVPPHIVSTQGKAHGIVLTFSKPMNPVEASNVNNYAVSWSTTHSKCDSLGLFAVFMPGAWSNGTTSSSRSVRLKSAQYDPATNSVTLIPKRKLIFLRTNHRRALCATSNRSNSAVKGFVELLIAVTPTISRSLSLTVRAGNEFMHHVEPE